MPQYKVPQNIDLPDKIVGPLTILQFGYLLIGGMISFALIKTGNLIVIVLIAIPLILLSLALAFLKIQNQSFGKFFINLIIFTFNPKARVWHKGKSSLPASIKPGSSTPAPGELQIITPKRLDKKSLAEVSKKLDSP